MKILWLCNMILPNIALKLQQKASYFGGWMVGLADQILEEDNIKLIVCAPIYNETKAIEGNDKNLSYYCFPQNNRCLSKYDIDIEKYIQYILEKVNPDVVHIFGTEYPHSLAMINVCEKLGILDKVVINIQGLVSVISSHYNANLPNKIVNRYTIRDIIKNNNINKQKKEFYKRGKFEIEAIKKCKHIIGRTDWDKACTTQINPNIKYHFCNETLRESFYKNTWDINKCKKHSIFISQCSYPIKGFHFMLEAMPQILKKYPDAHIYTTGKNPLKLNIFIDKIKITSYQKYIGELIEKYNLQNNVTFLGSLNEQEMCNQFLKSHVFVSPSVIENSPNSVGEAMILGVPTISSDVGGVKNMLVHDKEGFIYQHDAPYMLAHYVCEVFSNDELALKFSENAKVHANITHNKNLNLENMINIYKEIVQL